MEYVHQRGSFDDLPLAQIMVDFRRYSPRWLAEMDLRAQDAAAAPDFMAEVEQETRPSAPQA